MGAGNWAVYGLALHFLDEHGIFFLWCAATSTILSRIMGILSATSEIPERDPIRRQVGKPAPGWRPVSEIEISGLFAYFR